jgi:hypothetical protein
MYDLNRRADELLSATQDAEDVKRAFWNSTGRQGV